MDEVEQIKQRLSVVDVVGQYVTLHKSGKNYKGLCPFHGEKTPSFMVSGDLGIYKCFGCGKSGDIFTFVQDIEGVDFVHALKQLADRAGVELAERNADPNAQLKKKILEINHLTTEFYRYILLKHKLGVEGLTYCRKKRKLTDKTILDFKLGFAPSSWDLLYNVLLKKGYSESELIAAGVALKKNNGTGCIDKFRNRLIFPLKDVDGSVIGFAGRSLGDEQPKYLNTSETLVFHKSFFVYALDKTRLYLKKKGIVLVEGYMDAISAHQLGFDNVVAASGTSLTLTQLKILKRYSDDLTFCFDSDTAGSAATLRAIELAENLGFNIKVALLPKGIKDLDELAAKGQPAVAAVLDNTIGAYDFYLADALKKNDKTSAIGKKKILQGLAGIYSKISNEVVFDHYVKKLSDELNIEPDLVVASIKKLPTAAQIPSDTADLSIKHSPEDYLLTLLFKAPVDIVADFMYKNEHSLKYTDFEDVSRAGEVYRRYLAEYRGGVKEFDIKYFSELLGPDLGEYVKELYMWELDGGTRYEIELQNTMSRVVEAAKKRERKELSGKIKLAEMQKDSALVKRLSEEFLKII